MCLTFLLKDVVSNPHPTPMVLDTHQRDYQADGHHNKNPLSPSGVDR
jgi:hypothetical protein